MPAQQPGGGRALRVFDSYRGRYIFIAIVLITVLVTLAAVGYFQVDEASRGKIHNIRARALAADALSDVREQLAALRAGLAGFIMEPGEPRHQALQRSLSQFGVALDHLRASAWIESRTDVAGISGELILDGNHLEQETRDLVRIRTDVRLWFPAMGLMQEVMLPRSESFQANLAELIRESEEMPATGVGSIRDDMLALRHAWVRMISENRLLVANSFGIFADDPARAVRARIGNVDIYLEEVEQGLARLRGYFESGQPEFFGADLLPELESEFRQWRDAYGRLTAALAGEGWRRDLLQLHQIEVLVARLVQRLDALGFEIDLQSAEDINGLTDVARKVSRFGVLIAVVGVVLIIAGYFSFSRSLLAPIAATSHALKQAAQGHSVELSPQVDLAETRDLVDAFRQMREQVRIRESRLDHLAHHDALTRLPNRLLFTDRLVHALDLARREGTLVGLMFLDLDRFKSINDSLGHSVGDALLITVAERLCGGLRTSDTVARLSGDEFAILVEGSRERQTLADLAGKVLSVFEKPFVIEEQELFVSVSVGIAVAPEHATRPDRLLRCADQAMYQAKQLGRHRICFYSDELEGQSSRSPALEAQLRHALENGEFEIHYQPLVAARGGQDHAWEALLRWRHPREGILAPARFLPMLEETGLIAGVTIWMLDELSHLIESEVGSARALPPIFSVNMSGRLLRDEAFAEAFLRRLQQGSLPGERLVVEITEDTLIRELDDAMRLLSALRKFGVRIALDDFGTGQSSLDHLRRFPFDMVKIDREFVRDVDSDPNDAKLVRAMIRLAHTFGMTVAAEGVETHGQRTFVVKQGCDYLQGYLICRPAPAGDLPRLKPPARRAI